MTVEVGPDVEAFIELLGERKVLVPQASDMEGYMRICVGLPREKAPSWKSSAS